MAAEVRIGASGFSYKEWLGGFYPAKLPGAKMLAYYAERLPTVEINYTFRRRATTSMLTGWAERTPEGFRFAFKAPQRITHFARLREAGKMASEFIETTAALGRRRGPILFQLPPDFPRDLPLLEDFLAELPRGVPAVMEFRHRGWFDDGIFEVMRKAEAGLCITESDESITPFERTAPLAYLRLRRTTYSEVELGEWAERICAMMRDGGEIYAYFRHEPTAPSYAARLAQRIGDSN